ncbi:PAC2 family protein [Acidipropionibacterium acidipropionici ATCC 4875]|uniref:PAC2 family protein n=1 Tax=Acidipropionibacterium acidipropionici (strain ATCC 4875 / DSM 20272 / JCM 6432 / NBRC 12425 / NCIMB 8070 / 4) TaxID=1171373 RepID=K7SJM7_ACIA4|nr:PAC2 family protein [Acidipropionibacterium acidipropionici]AFV89485.1 PAC2 family protein [Acidipropionibacterium acidipropionici ATCC 4875]
MNDKENQLFGWSPDIDPDEIDVSTLILTIGSFTDIGHAQQHLRQSMLAELAHRELGEFRLDEILDHRDSRPPIIFDADHFEGYESPRMVLHEVTDELGQSFLLLDGPEPALRWNQMVDEIRGIIDELGVRLSVVTQSIPMPAPHTRPVQVTRWSSRPELIIGHSSPFGRIQMPASFPAVLSQRLGESRHDVVGLAAHVPHYLTDVDYPDAARALVDAIRQLTGLALPSHALAMAAGVVRAQISNQVEDSEELQAMVSALEEQYDDQSGRREIESQQVTLPSADDIGAEAEAFLRSMDDPGDDGGTPVQGPTTPDRPAGDSGDEDPQAGQESPKGRRSEDGDDGDGPDDEGDGGPTDLYRPRHGDDSWGLS